MEQMMGTSLQRPSRGEGKHSGKHILRGFPALINRALEEPSGWKERTMLPF
jgi:hypothetical protein